MLRPQYYEYQGAIYAEFEGHEAELKELKIDKKLNMTIEEMLGMLETEFKHELKKDDLDLVIYEGTYHIWEV